MASRTKILVVDQDLDSLSRIYLALVHRNYKAEASDKTEEIMERINRFRPALLIVEQKAYDALADKPRIPVIIIDDGTNEFSLADAKKISEIKKPVVLEQLLRMIEELI